MIVRLRKTTSRLGRVCAEYPEFGFLWAWPKFVNLQMTDAEKQSFIAAAVQRAPGKRQIKPSAALIDLEVFGNDEEDDEDFVAKSDDSGEGESESSDVDEDESEGSDEEGEGSDAEEKNVDVKLDLDAEATDSAHPICAICLNMRQSAKNELPMTCDGCGLVVHETCYLPDVGDETDSTHSLETTEPWFCEPCIYGLKEPPHCELCPNRFGAFKRSDIGGRWVHLLCALYTQGVTFGDVDNLMAISWQELDHRQFGRKSCSACNDRLQARTGIVTNCEVGLCKEYFHITCAQRMGYLVDNSENEHVDDSVEIEPRFIYCRAHSNSDVVREKKRTYARFLAQEEKRITVMHRKKLNEREERKIQKALQRSQKKFESLVGITIGWPDANLDYQNDRKIRRSRQLHTSARYLDLFQEKAELNDVDKDAFQQEFLRIKGDQLAFLSPGFSREFIEYFENREAKILPQEQKRLEAMKEQNAELKKQQNKLHDEYKQLEQKASSVHDRVDHLKALTADVYETLVRLGAKKLKKPSYLDDVVNGSSAPNKRIRKRNGSLSSPKPKKNACPSAKLSTSDASPKDHPVSTLVLHTCDECKKTTDQHLLVDCDECNNFYHIGCLDPPLDRLPKKSKYGWICSKCNESSDSEASEQVDPSPVDDDNSNDGVTRRLRQRCDHTKARKIAEQEEQRRAYKSAIASGAPRRGSAKRKSDLTVLNSSKDEPTKKHRGSQNTPPNNSSGFSSPNGRNSVLSHASPDSRRSGRHSQPVMVLDDFEL